MFDPFTARNSVGMSLTRRLWNANVSGRTPSSRISGSGVNANPIRRPQLAAADIPHGKPPHHFAKPSVGPVEREIEQQTILFFAPETDLGFIVLCEAGELPDQPLLQGDGERHGSAISLSPGAGRVEGGIQRERRSQLQGGVFASWIPT